MSASTGKMPSGPRRLVPSAGTARSVDRRPGHHRAHGPDPEPGRARAPGARAGLCSRRPPAARGRVRAGRWPAAARAGSRAPPGSDRGEPPWGLAAAGPRWAGLDGDGGRGRPRAARPGHRRSVVVHPRGVQRAHPLRPGPAPALPRPVDAWRALGVLRDHRGPGRVRPADAGGHGGPRPGDRRLRAQRREVVRDRAGRHRLHDLPLQRRRRRRPPADPLPGRLRHPGPAPQARPRLHPHVRRPASPVRARRRPRAGARRSSGRSAPPTS